MGSTAIAGAHAPAQAPMKHAPTKGTVGAANGHGAKGTKEPKGAKEPKGSSGATAQAAKGAGHVKHHGGGGSAGGASDMGAILDALRGVTEALTALVEALQSPTQGGGSGCDQPMQKGDVAGVQGGSATTGDYVAPAAAPHASAEDNDFEARVLDLVNAERAKYGLAPVRYNDALDSAAEKHATHMAGVGRMAHDGIGDGDPGSRVRAEGFGDAWGENVAAGQTSPEQVVAEWMASPGHRRNILDPNYRQLGVAYTAAANGRTYWAQEFGA